MAALFSVFSSDMCLFICFPRSCLFCQISMFVSKFIQCCYAIGLLLCCKVCKVFYHLSHIPQFHFLTAIANLPLYSILCCQLFFKVCQIFSQVCQAIPAGVSRPIHKLKEAFSADSYDWFHSHVSALPLQPINWSTNSENNPKFLHAITNYFFGHFLLNEVLFIYNM